MKRFKDLTELEIKDLSQLDLAKYINLECAENGIAFVDKPNKPEYAKDIEHDMKVYSVTRGYSTLYIDFVKESDAKKVADLLNECEIVEKGVLFSIAPKLSYSEVAEHKQKVVKSVNKKAKEEYEKDLAEYNEFKTKQEEVSAPICEEYDRIAEKYSRLDRIKDKFNNTYLPLADGNEEIAKRFLRDAYAISSEDEVYIFSE